MSEYSTGATYVDRRYVCRFPTLPPSVFPAVNLAWLGWPRNRRCGVGAPAAIARQTCARIVAVSGGIIIRSSREWREPIKLIVCASGAPNQSSRTSRPSMVIMIWGRPSHAAAFSVIRHTGSSWSVTAATSVGSSVAGSRLRGHQPPSGTPSAVDERGNTSRGSCCADVMRRAALCGERPRTDIMSALPPPVSNRLPALTTTPTWTSALDVPPVTAPYSHLSASSAGETAARAPFQPVRSPGRPPDVQRR
jgi:hypothetical protein